MLKSLWSRIRGYVSFDAEPLSLSAQGDQLVCWAAPFLPTGRKVRATLPSGLVVYGETLWQRAVQDDHGRKLSCIRLGAQPLVSPESVAHPKGVRGNRRIPTRQWISFPHLKGASGLSEDLSVDGCRVRLDLSHHLGEIHTMSLDLPGSADSVSVMAKVLWSRDGQSGLRFLNMHIEDEARLARSLGLGSHPARECWDQVWRRSLVSLTYRVTRLEEDLVSLDFETSNWLATFQIRPAGIEGEWTGRFCRVDTLDSSLQLAEARQATRIALDGSRSLVHLRLLDEQNRVKLEIWGQEHAFSRIPREKQNIAR